MKTENILAKRESLAQKKASLDRKQKLLNDREKKLQIRKFIKLGELASKAGIEDFEPTALLGAFLDIKEQSNNLEVMKKWGKQGEISLQQDRLTSLQKMIVSFGATPDNETKALLKNRKFRRNNFRKEWYGYGDLAEIEQILANKQAKIEVVPLED